MNAQPLTMTRMPNIRPEIRNDNANPERLPEGCTIEIGSVRVHRYRTHLEITDLTYAGKRGKKCNRLSVDPQDWTKGLENSLVEYIIRTLELSPFFEAAVRSARLVAVSMVREIREIRAIDVTPKGQDLRITGCQVTAHFEPNDFCIEESLDFNNETRATHLDDYGKRNAVTAHKWAMNHRDEIPEMSFRQVLDALTNEGVRFHRYCGMD